MQNVEIRECAHAERIRAQGGVPNITNCSINLGETAEGSPVILLVCVECWQQIKGLVLEEIIQSALRDAFCSRRQHD